MNQNRALQIDINSMMTMMVYMMIIVMMMRMMNKALEEPKERSFLIGGAKLPAGYVPVREYRRATTEKPPKAPPRITEEEELQEKKTTLENTGREMARDAGVEFVRLDEGWQAKYATPIYWFKDAKGNKIRAYDLEELKGKLSLISEEHHSPSPGVIVLPKLPEEARGDFLFYEYIRDLSKLRKEPITEEEARRLWEGWSEKKTEHHSPGEKIWYLGEWWEEGYSTAEAVVYRSADGKKRLYVYWDGTKEVKPAPHLGSSPVCSRCGSIIFRTTEKYYDTPQGIFCFGCVPKIYKTTEYEKVYKPVSGEHHSGQKEGFWLGIAGAERKFPLGQIVMTRGVNDLVAENAEFSQFVVESFRRHASGDWGDLPPEDKRENEYALDKRLRLLSAYEKPPLRKIWIITEADRSATTILFPEEY